MVEQIIRKNTQTFLLSGLEIQDGLHRRAIRHQTEIDQCLNKVANMLLEKENKDIQKLATQAATAMLVIVSNEYLASDALVVKTQLDRASYLMSDRLDLLCIEKNINPNFSYEVSLKEAKHYGLV